MTNRPRGELKRLAREYLLDKYTIPMLAILTAAFLPGVLLAPFSIGLTVGVNLATVTYAIAAAIIEILGQLLSVGVIRMHLMLARRQQFSYMDLFWAFRNRPDTFILATALLYGALLLPAVPAGIGIFYLTQQDPAGGSVYLYALLTVAVIACIAVWIYVIYTFAFIYPFYIEDPQMPVIEGFRASKALMKGNKKRLFVLQLSFIGWQILGLCSMGIGLLWIEPYITQTTANFYLDLTDGFNGEDKTAIDDIQIK